MERQNVSGVAGKHELTVSRSAYGQNNIVPWEELRSVFEGIFSRKYYTNQGMLVSELEAQLEEKLAIGNVLCITNESIALMITLKALEIEGDVLVPIGAPVEVLQALEWVQCRPVFCDLDSKSYQVSTDTLLASWHDGINAIIAPGFFSSLPDMRSIKRFAKEQGVPSVFYLNESFGCIPRESDHYLAGSVSIFSFGQANILNSGEGACVCTDDDELAEVIRNIRSSYGVRRQVSIPFTGNGRMSEAQGGMALASLKYLDTFISRNVEQFELYRNTLQVSDYFTVYRSEEGLKKGNFQTASLVVDEALAADEAFMRSVRCANLDKGYFPFICRYDSYKGRYSLNGLSERYPVFFSILERAIVLPVGSNVTNDVIHSICAALLNAQTAASVK